MVETKARRESVSKQVGRTIILSLIQDTFVYGTTENERTRHMHVHTHMAGGSDTCHNTWQRHEASETYSRLIT